MSKMTEARMTKAELVARMTEKHPNLSLKKMNEVVDRLLITMKNGLVEGRRIELRGFASFGTRAWKARYARHPVTEKTWRTEPRRAIYFRAGKKLRELINGASKEMRSVENSE